MDLYENILELSNSTKDLKINPTIIYNEGWLLRILVSYSMDLELCFKGLNFKKSYNWTSEGLLSSPFVDVKAGALKNKGEAIRREGYTHVDAAIGDFEIKYNDSARIRLKPIANYFAVIEAKLKSNLSRETSNAKDYNQATRNIICIASNVIESKCDSSFIIVAPETTIKKHKIESQIEKETIMMQAKDRFDYYNDEFKKNKKYGLIVDKIRTMNIQLITFEEWIDILPSSETKDKIDKFYKECLKWNKIKL